VASRRDVEFASFLKERADEADRVLRDKRTTASIRREVDRDGGFAVAIRHIAKDKYPDGLTKLVIAKRLDAPYTSNERAGMVKIKPRRTADCVVGGFRYAEPSRVVGSLLLGLYDEKGLLHHVGFCSGLKASERPALTKKLEAATGGRGFTGKAPGGPSRWSTKRSTEWQPLKPKFVVEVSFDHVTGGRFRHGTRLLRWRLDKSPAQCTFQQLEQRKSRAVSWLK